ncbi:MAG: hypothetical protein ABIN91_10130 [Mucilaginibacter sp.]|uniref:hypothetical protein n=1 Tax=Mucilaginibacter sp. TaxID=1882438 RepID=UPI003266D998
MKKIFLLFSFVFVFQAVLYAQQAQNTDEEPFFYEVSGLIYVNHYDAANKIPETDYFKIPREPLKFKIVGKEKNIHNQNDYVIIKFLPITVDNITKGGKSLTGDDVFINSEDNDEYFWINKADLDTYLANGLIKKSYVTPNIKFDYGASVSLPFKYRLSTAGQNSKITPDVTLGGYAGFKSRISKSQPYYVTFPILTLGLSTISINDNTVTPTSPGSTSPSVADGLVLGVTGSTGIVFRFDDFQIGFIVGIDRATGEIGKNWIYNDKPWYSLSIGYTFLRKPDVGK